MVRKSIKEYEARSDKLSDEERRRMLAALDRIKQEPPARTRRRWGRRATQ